MNTPIARDEIILARFPFLPGNEKWGGEIQVIRATVTQNGQERVYINKKLVFTGSGRFTNLPREVEELVQAIFAATEVEKESYSSLMAEISQRRTPRSPVYEQPAPRRDDGRRARGRNRDEGDYR